MTELEAIEGLKLLAPFLMYYGEERDDHGHAQRITELILSESELTNDFMRGVVGYLGYLPHLQWVDFEGNDFTDEALPLLYDLKHLSAIDLDNNDLTSAAVDALRARLPNCRISFQETGA